MSAEPVIRAAGGVVWREADGGLEVLLVHRPRYDDWTLPKGKAKAGESYEDCALREIEEETGLRCVLEQELASSSYPVQGEPKLVRFWAMRPLGGSFTPHGEVDRIEWLSLSAAAELLSYDRDRAVLGSFTGAGR